MFPFSTDVDVLAVLVADRSALAAQHLTWPEPDRRSRILVPGRWIDVPTKINFRSGERTLSLLEVAETGSDRGQFVAIGIGHRFRGLHAARQTSKIKKKKNYQLLKNINGKTEH